MKKFLAILLCLCMALTAVACSSEAEYKLGMGVDVNMGSSAETNAQIDATVAAVVTDADGKIVMVRLDCAQNKMNTTDGVVDTAATFKSKMELGDDYGMAPVGIDNNGDGKSLEWYDQAKAFETWCVGKTAADLEGMTSQEANGHMISTDEALLSAGCTIQFDGFQKAVIAACKDEQGMTFTAKADSFTLGVAANTTAAESVAATADENGTVKMYSDFGAAVVDAEGKIVAALNDAIQPNITIDADGLVVETAFKATKRELKEEYNMATYGAEMDNDGDGRVLEWYIQSAAFSAHVVGMTGAEVAAMETTEAAGHLISTDADLLSAGCSMQITGLCAVVADACGYAR